MGTKDNFILFLSRWLKPLIWFIFRISVKGEEHLKKDSRQMIIANHNSGALIESHSLVFICFQKGIKLFGLNHKALFKIPLVGLYFKKIGAIPATKDDAKKVLNNNHSLLIFPGGNKQAFRPLSKKNENSFPWAKGWAKIAFEEKAPVVPVKFNGTHNINPIFFSSTLLSKVLILPWVLGVTTFPFSLAQIVTSLTFASLVFTFTSSFLITFIVLYFAFIFSPLVPILPSRVKIKIYPEIRYGRDYNSPEELISLMNLIMRKKDLPYGKKKKYKLNGIERFMLASQSKDAGYNSQFIFDFEGTLNKDKILETTSLWVDKLPHLKSVVEKSWIWDERFIFENTWFEAPDIVLFSNKICSQELDSFSSNSFSLQFDAAVRILIQSENNKHRLIFCASHSLFDGAAQANAFNLWVKLYNGKHNLKPKTINSFHYKSIYKKTGVIKSLKLFFKTLNAKSSQSLPDIASLSHKEDTGSRRVSSLSFDLNKEHSLLVNEFLPSLTLAMNETLNHFNKDDSPMIIWAPSGLRGLLKIHSSFQNAVISRVFFIKKNLPFDKIKEKIEAKTSKNIISENVKFLFGLLPLFYFFSSKYLKKKFQSYDSTTSPISSTVLAVDARIPKTYPEPNDWDNLKISARGTLFKSPSIGVILTGKRGSETLTIEYIPSLIDKSRVLFLAGSLLSKDNSKYTEGLQPVSL